MRNVRDFKDSSFLSEDIWLTEISPESSVDFYDKVNQKFNDNPNLALPIYINSPGGDVVAMFSIMDHMDAIRSIAPPTFYFVTIVMGEACSAAADILAHGDFRIALPKASIMIHQSSAGAAGHIEDLKITVKEQERLNDLAAKIFVENVGLPGGVSAYKKLAARDKYMTPKEALELGVIDAVGFPRFEKIEFVRTIIQNQRLDRSQDIEKFLHVDDNDAAQEEQKPKRKRKVKDE